MSFDIYFIAMKRGKNSVIPMLETLKAFEGHCELERIVQHRDDETHIWWESLSGDSKWGYITINAFEGDEKLCRDISVNCPTCDPMFWKTMFGLMEKFPLGMVFPTTNMRWVLANESFREDFQADDMSIEIVSTSEALCETISND